MNRNEWIIQAARLQAAEQPFALVTVLRAQAPTSGKAGDKAVGVGTDTLQRPR